MDWMRAPEGAPGGEVGVEGAAEVQVRSDRVAVSGDVVSERLGDGNPYASG